MFLSLEAHFEILESVFVDVNTDADASNGYSYNNRMRMQKVTKPTSSLTNDTEFPCPNRCGRVYHLKNSLYKHMKFDCGVEKQFECQVCHKAFSRKTSMRNHVFLVHKQIAS